MILLIISCLIFKTSLIQRNLLFYSNVRKAPLEKIKLLEFNGSYLLTVLLFQLDDTRVGFALSRHRFYPIQKLFHRFDPSVLKRSKHSAINLRLKQIHFQQKEIFLSPQI